MVGLCGSVGDRTDLPPSFVDAVAWRDDEVGGSFTDDRFALETSFHRLFAGAEPARARDGDALVWVWGDVYGFGSGDSYVSRDGPTDGSARYVADLYDSYGLDCVADLNGDFGLVIYDKREESVAFVTDRVGTHPFFYTHPSDDEFVFASNVQALPAHPAVDPTFDEAFLYEYFQIRRVLGVETPLEGIREIPPGSIATVDLDDGSLSVDTYWRPSYEPVDESFETYLQRFTDTFQTVMDEWTRDDLDYGLLLSGGSDSRLVQATMDQPTKGMHVADWMSREATVAQEAAAVNGDEFQLLERDADAESNALETNPLLSNFSGWFDQGYFSGFESELADEVDVLISGLYADTLFKGSKFDTRTLSLDPIGTVSLPFRDPVESIDDYVSLKTKSTVEPLSYTTSDLSIDEVIADNIHRDGDGVVSHGVRYESLTDLVLYGDYYPVTADTDAIFSRSLMQMLPYRSPFLDNRLLDLQQQIPIRYFLRRNLIDQAVAKLSPELASIPHARTGMPLEQRFPLDYLGGNLTGFWRKHVDEEEPPEPHLDHGPWPDRRALLRTQSFPVETLVENRDRFEAFDFLDYDGALESYRNHLSGGDESTVLYSLLTFLEMPVTEQVSEQERDDGDVDRATLVGTEGNR